MPGGPSIRVTSAIGLTLCLPFVAAAQSVDVEARPRIGLALGGLRAVVVGRRTGGDSSAASGASEGSTVVPTSDSGRVFVAFRAATSFGDTASPFYQFTQGGLFSLGAFDRDQFRGAHAAYLGAGYLREIGRLPDLLGGAIDVGVWVESGSAFQTREDADIHSNLSAGLLIETVIGALLVSGSVLRGSRSSLLVGSWS